MGVERFTHGEGWHANLPIPHADIVGDGVAGNHFGGAVLWHVAAIAANDHSQFALIVYLVRGARNVYAFARSDHRGGLLIKDHGNFRGLHAGFFNMISVVETDRQNFWRSENGRFQGHVGQRKPGGALFSGLPCACQGICAGGQEGTHLGGEVWGSGGQVNNVLAVHYADAGRSGLGKGH